ncbi:hypothetical protein Taro_010086 [Colocasia esculenta]|uniref:F-box protein n=1 Tax=Colocasia esculenta TaxID=4460 RepID=A0A843U8H8_COLES|nr:hypothetical protein [Colocasia esculenta]
MAADGIPSALPAAITIEDLHPDVLTRTLRLLDGPALAAASCATSRLRALAAQPCLWEDLCLSAWPSLRDPRLRDLLPSFPASHRSFFSDAFPFPDPSEESRPCQDAPAVLISSIDLFHEGEHVFSRVLETDARDPWFLGSPFRIDALDRKDEGSTLAAPISPEDLTLSWVVIDPARGRAVNLSSRRPVSVERHWYTGEIQVRFAVVLGGGEAAANAVVACGEETMQPREVNLTVQDVDGMCLNGKESLVVLRGAMKGRRMGWGGEGEAEARRRYAEYAAAKQERKERRMRREGRLDMCCIVLGVSLFLGLFAFAALR